VGFLDTGTGHRALRSAQQLITGLVTEGSVEQWLNTRGFDLDWADPDTVVLTPAEESI
jgi:hypothetical protein